MDALTQAASSAASADDALVRRAQTGDAAAFELLVDSRIERGRWLRKLRRLLADARLPTARRLVADIGLIRLAIQLYARPDQSIERAAYDLGYRSPASAARQLRAMLSMPVAGIRRCWPWEWMIDRAWPEPDPRPAATSPRSDDPCERRRVSS